MDSASSDKSSAECDRMAFKDELKRSVLLDINCQVDNTPEFTTADGYKAHLKHLSERLISKPSQTMIFHEDLIAVHMKNTKLYFNKPVYLGMRILDLNKSLMYDFHYNYIKTKYGDKAKLLFTDTNSLAYKIRTKDFYKDIKPDIEKRFDTSDYPTNHPSGIKT